ncbi:MAG: siderophore-interacting protein [Congregibacter sp.]
MSRPAPRALTVLGSNYVTPNMFRVTLGGTGLGDFPKNQESAYVKIILAQPDNAPSLTRTYTISAQRDDEIDLDFVLHAGTSPATSWALAAQRGDQILVGGPGPKKLINREADWFFLVGDMTALPAITINLASLGENAQGYAVIQVKEESDIQPMQCPAGIALHWVIKRDPDSNDSSLLEQIKELPWLPGEVAVWAACEFHSMRMLRKYFKFERQISKDKLYVSSYWKIGSTEDQHKIAKQNDTRLDQSESNA